ncbi:uncharacterized protein TNCV_2097561 [Trichonephila clavipes]|nr:uncharacterized protein TNCV_2097561 [Trichonephila clavipes]
MNFWVLFRFAGGSDKVAKKDTIDAKRNILPVSITNKTNAGCIVLADIAVNLHFAPTPSQRPPLATLFLEVRPSNICHLSGTFLRLPRFPQVVFNVGIGISSPKNAAADCDNSVVAIDEPCAAETWLKSATLVFGYHFDMAKKRILTQDEIDRYMNNSGELSKLSEDGLEYSDNDVDFYLTVCHLMKIRMVTVKIVLCGSQNTIHNIKEKSNEDNKLDREIFQSENLF